MTKFLSFFAIIFLINNFAQAQVEMFYDYGYGKYGVIDATSHDTILPFEFDKITISANGKFILAGKDYLYGAFDSKGNEIIPMNFANISDQGNFIMVVTENDKVALYNYQGKEVIPFGYAFLGDISEGLMRANKGGTTYWHTGGIFSGEDVEVTGGLWTFIDTNGTSITNQRLTYARDFKDGIASVYIGGNNDDWVYGGKWTYLKKDGDLLMDKTDDVSNPVDGLFVVTSETPHGVEKVKKFLKSHEPPFTGVVDKDENILIPFVYDHISILSSSLIACKTIEINNEGEEVTQIDVFNKKGTKALDFSVQEIKREGDLVYVRKDNLWGIYSLEGNEILSPQYNNIKEFYYYNWGVEPTELMITKETAGGEKYGLITMNGKSLLEAKYDTIYGAFEFKDIILTKEDKEFTCYFKHEKMFSVNCDSMLIMSPLRAFQEDLIQVETGTQSIIFNLYGEIVFDWEGVKIIHNTELIDDGKNVFVAVKEGKQGLVRMDKKILIPFKFDRLVEWTTLESHYDDLQYTYPKNLINATYEGKKTLIDQKGKILLPPVEGDFKIDPNPIRWEDNRLSLTRYGDEWPNRYCVGGMDTLGNIIAYPIYREISFFPNDYYMVVPWDDYSYQVYQIGDTTRKYRFSAISTESDEDFIFCEVDEKWYTMDVNTMTLSENYFDDIEDDGFYCDMSIVTVNGKKGVIDNNGNYLIEPIYDELYTRSACIISDYHNEHGQDYSAKINGKWGGINTTGEKLTEFIFDSPGEIWESDGDFYRWD